MADYYINSDYGKQLAGSLKAGDMAEASDGSTWRKEADGSVTVWKNGQTMTGRVGVSAPAVSEAPSSSASPTVETPTLDAATGGSSQQTTAADYTGSAQEQRDQEQAQARLASEKAKAATEKVTAGLGQSSSDELLNQAIQQASTPEYKISSAQGVLLADELRMAGDMAEASDGSTWRREADGSISVRKGDRTYKANIDRAAAKQDPQWAILTAPAPAAAETGSGKKSSRKSSSGSASSGGSGTYTFPAASTGTQKTPTATTTGTDRASLRKQAATAQKEMGDLARQISVAKIRGKDTSALQAKYNEAKARYDAANTQIQAPKSTGAEGPTLIEAATRAPEKAAELAQRQAERAQNLRERQAEQEYIIPQQTPDEKFALTRQIQEKQESRDESVKIANTRKELIDISNQIKAGKARGRDTSALEAQYNGLDVYLNGLQAARAYQNTADETETRRGFGSEKPLWQSKKEASVSEAEFNRSSAMVQKYGSYDNYLRGVYAGYDKAREVGTRRRAAAVVDSGKVSEAEFNRSTTMVEQYGTYQNYLNGVRRSNTEIGQERAQRRIESLGIADLLEQYYNSEGEEQARLRQFLKNYGVTGEELNTWRNLFFSGTGARKYIGDLGTALFQGGMQQWQSGVEGALAGVENAANKAAAWTLNGLSYNLPEGKLKYGMNELADQLRSADTGHEKNAEILQQQLADTMRETTKDHSGAGKWVIEQMPSMGNMLLNSASAGMTGLPSLATLGTTAGGSAYIDARNDGASHEQALAYGIVNGALEVGSEKLFGGNPLYDTDAGLVNKLVSKLTKNPTILGILDNKGFDLLSEGLEEVVTEITEPWAQALIYAGKDADFATTESVANAFLGGVFMSAVGKAAALPGQLRSREAQTEINAAGQSVFRQALQTGDPNVQNAVHDVQSKIATGAQLTVEDIGHVLDVMAESNYEASPTQTAQDVSYSPNQTAQQTTQGTAERGAESVITGNEAPALDEAMRSTFTEALSGISSDVATNKPQNVKNLLNATKEQITRFIQNAFNKQNQFQYLKISDVSPELAETLRAAGINVDGYAHALRDNDIRHVESSHGSQSNDKYKVTADMLGDVQNVIDNYDVLYRGFDTRFGNPTVVYEKRMGNRTFYVEEVMADGVLGTKQMVVTGENSKPSFLKKYTEVASVSDDTDVPARSGSTGQSPPGNHVPDAPYNTSYNPTVAQPGNSVNQNISATDSTGAAPAGFDPLSHASNQYGAIPPGEKASRVVDIPASMDGETKVRRFTRTAAEAQVTTDEMVNRIENLVADGKLDYEVYGNKQALQDGKELIEKQYTRGKTIEQIRSDFIRDANNGKGGAKFVSQGTMLYADAIAAGDYQTASDILVALAAVETNAGQTVQAARLLKSMSPEGRVFTVQQMVSNLEAQINQRRSANKQIEINVPDALLNAYQNATTETAQQTALDNIYQNIADQVPTTLREGLQQWRYFSMLANPSTHAKNIMGNVSGAAAKIGKDNLGALLETIFIGDKPGQRTKAFLNVTSEADQNLLNMAWADYDTASELFEDSVGKYSQASGEINDRRRYWKINDPQNAVTKGIDKALGAAEKVADFNTKALEVEDIWFSKPMYATALASYMKANHMTEITDAARTYAMSEAKRGTFNDLNAVSKWASQIGNDSKLGRFLAGTIYPFKKVPANVMVRTVEYSPLGFAKGVYDLVQMSKGNTDYTAAKAIDDFAAGTTGTALLGIGIALAKQGILRATGIGDDKEKEQQKNAFGAKDFSLIAGDTYIPIDSFTLNGTALLTGAQIWEAVQNAKNGDEPVSLEDILDALSKITDPVFEQSMLTGLDSVISTIKNSGNDVGTGEMLAKLGILIVGNYIGQYVPTILGRIASSTDKNQRSTYIEPDGAWDPIQSAIQGVQKKVPGWRQQMAITYGNWGVPVEGNGAGSTASAIGKAVTPIYPSQKKTDPVEEEIARLHEADSAYANFYKRPSKTISVDGKDVKLTSEQYGNYVVARGQTDYNLRSAMLENDLYKSLPDQVKSKAMGMSQAYATEIGREAAGVGYQSSEKWVNDLAGKSQDDVLNAVLLRAVESSGYISPETQAQLTKVEQQFGGADYVGLSDELFNSAKEKANTYFSAVEAAKYGGELTETQKDLAGKDSKELARYFMDEAISDKFQNSKGETKFDKVLTAYEDKELNEAVAMAVLSDDAVQAYNRYGKSAGVTPEMMLMASNAKASIKEETDEDGKVTNSAKDQFNAWLDKQWQSGTMKRWTEDQKDAVRMAFYKDASTTYSYLSDQLHKGNINTAAAKSELSTTYQSGWTHNVKDTGAKMVDYVDAIVEYEDRPSSEELDDAGYSYVWQWFCDYLNTTDLTREQKYAMAISIKKNDYGEGTMKKIWNRLR